jgi:hypothetical protein
MNPATLPNDAACRPLCSIGVGARASRVVCCWRTRGRRSSLDQAARSTRWSQEPGSCCLMQNRSIGNLGYARSTATPAAACHGGELWRQRQVNTRNERFSTGIRTPGTCGALSESDFTARVEGVFKCLLNRRLTVGNEAAASIQSSALPSRVAQLPDASWFPQAAENSHTDVPRGTFS